MTSGSDGRMLVEVDDLRHSRGHTARHGALSVDVTVRTKVVVIRILIPTCCHQRTDGITAFFCDDARNQLIPLLCILFCNKFIINDILNLGTDADKPVFDILRHVFHHKTAGIRVSQDRSGAVVVGHNHPSLLIIQIKDVKMLIFNAFVGDLRHLDSCFVLHHEVFTYLKRFVGTDMFGRHRNLQKHSNCC